MKKTLKTTNEKIEKPEFTNGHGKRENSCGIDCGATLPYIVLLTLASQIKKRKR